MNIFRKLAFALAGMVAMGSSVAPAFASSAEYISQIAAPIVYSTNTIYTSGHFYVGTTTSGTVSHIAWQLSYQATTQPLTMRICQSGTKVLCTPWNSAFTGTSTIFTGRPSLNYFYMESQVQKSPFTTAVQISPIYANGYSVINVYYDY